ncbi:MAG: apolipoprotein N-acyltransferase [Actinomycetota bacterium]
MAETSPTTDTPATDTPATDTPTADTPSADTPTADTAPSAPPAGGATAVGDRLPWLRAVVAGVCLAGSVPPWGWWPLAFIGIALLDGLLANRSARSRAARAWVVAAAWLYPATLWMWDLTAPGYVVAGSLFAAYFAIAAALTPSGPERRIVLPLTIALAEWARWSWPFGGVPLAHLALSQVDTPLGWAARLGGSLLVVVLVVVVGQALAAAFDAARASIGQADAGRTGDAEGEGRAGSGRAAAIGVAVAVGVVGAAALHPRADVVDTVDIALVQGGGAQQTRASSSQQPVVLGRHIEASRYLDQPVDLVIWPENVVNPGRYLAQGDAEALVRQVAAETDASVLAGWFYPDGGNTVNYHSTITPDGDEIDRYDKVKLVPFGEYVPLRGLIEQINDEIPTRDVRPGTVDNVLDTPVGPVGVSISWEGFFEVRARAAVRDGAQVLANPTNGSSYWLTQVQTQQVASNQLRALENDRWVLQVAPTGFSAVVDPDGTVVQRTGISERATLVDTVEMRSGRTLASIVGFWPVVLAAAAALVWAHRRRLGDLQSLRSSGPPARA